MTTYAWADHERSDEVAGARVSVHTCGCSASTPCPKGRRLLESGRLGHLMQHLFATLSERGDRPYARALTSELRRLRDLNRARARRGTS